MAPVCGSSKGYSGIDDPSGLLQYPQGMCTFTSQYLGHCLPDGGKYLVLMIQALGGINWELRARPKLALMLPQSHTVEATQDHVVVGIVTGVPNIHIMEKMAVRTKDKVRPGSHLLAKMEHAPRPAILRSWEIARDEVLHHVLKYLYHHR